MSVTVFLNYNMKNEILKLVQAGLHQEEDCV